MVPKLFYGKHLEFNEFILNCEDAMSLASNLQKQALLPLLISKLTGSVRYFLQGKKIKDWEEFKVTLCTFYQDQKHYIQLIEELNTVKQNFGKPVASFYERLDKLCAHIFGTIPFQSEEELQPKIETIKELALTFIIPTPIFLHFFNLKI